MSEFWESRNVKCRWCGKLYATCEGPLCDCEERAMEAEEMLREMEREREAFTDELFTRRVRHS